MPLLTEQAVDDEIAKDWAAIREAHAADDTAEPEAPAAAAAEPAAAGADGVPPKDGAAPEPDGKPAAAAAADDRPRDADGKFVKGKAGTAPAKVEKVAAAAEAVPPEGAAAQPADGAQPRDITRAPSSWKPQARVDFEKLPESVRAEIHRREGDYMAGQAQLLPDAQFGKEMRSTVDPFRILIESEGGTPATAVRELLLTAAALRTGTLGVKFQTMANIAARYGIPLQLQDKDGKPLTQQQAGQIPQQQQQFQDPRVDELLRSMQTRDQQEAQRAHEANLSAASTWMTATDAQGQPLRPYVNDVLDDMTARVQQLRAADPTLSATDALEKAYTAAIWANPDVRAVLLNQQQQQAEAKRRAESQQRVNGARRAASVNVPRRSSIPAPAAPGTMDETIRETARTLGLIT